MVPVEEVPLIQSRISQSDLAHCSGPHCKWLSKTPPRADGCHLPERRRLRDVVEQCDRPQEGHLFVKYFGCVQKNRCFCPKTLF